MSEFQIFQGIDSLYYWRLVYNGSIIAVSGEGHLTATICEIEILQVKRLAPNALVIQI